MGADSTLFEEDSPTRFAEAGISSLIQEVIEI